MTETPTQITDDPFDERRHAAPSPTHTVPAAVGRRDGSAGTAASPEGVTHDLFHNCALVAFVEAARACGGWPDRTAVKLRANQLYEGALAEKNARGRAPGPAQPPSRTGEPTT